MAANRCPRSPRRRVREPVAPDQPVRAGSASRRPGRGTPRRPAAIRHRADRRLGARGLVAAVWSLARPSLARVAPPPGRSARTGRSTVRAVGATRDGGAPAARPRYKPAAARLGRPGVRRGRDAIAAGRCSGALGADRTARGSDRGGQLAAWWSARSARWWPQRARIRVRESTSRARFGFAYGTLPATPSAARSASWWNGSTTTRVWYDLAAFSQPALWMARLARPVTRRLQRRFARLSKAAMRRAVAPASSSRDSKRGPGDLPLGRAGPARLAAATP